MPQFDRREFLGLLVASSACLALPAITGLETLRSEVWLPEWPYSYDTSFASFEQCVTGDWPRRRTLDDVLADVRRFFSRWDIQVHELAWEGVPVADLRGGFSVKWMAVVDSRSLLVAQERTREERRLLSAEDVVNIITRCRRHRALQVAYDNKVASMPTIAERIMEAERYVSV